MTAQRFWEDNRRMLTIVAVAGLTAVAVQIVVVGPISRAAERDRTKLGVLADALGKARTGSYDLADSSTALGRSSALIGEEIARLKEQVKFPWPEWVEIPKEYERDPATYFTIKHAMIREALLIECEKKKPRTVRIENPNLGFDEILGKALDHKNARVNLERLAVVEKITRLLIDTGVQTVSTFTLHEPVMTGARESTPFIKEYPVEIVARMRLDPLMGFLHEIRRPGEFFLVCRELAIVGTDPHRRDPAPAGADADESVLSVAIAAAGMTFPNERDLPKAVGTLAPVSESTIPRGVPLGH
jgi:hypothetical protein